MVSSPSAFRGGWRSRTGFQETRSGGSGILMRSALSDSEAIVSPAEKQQGRSGTTIRQAVVAVPGSIAIGYLMMTASHQTRLLQQFLGETAARVLLRVRNPDVAARRWVDEHTMGEIA